MKLIPKTIALILISLFTLSCSQAQQKNVKIALAQIFCLDGDRSGNFARIEGALEEAVGMGAEIVCFPETSIYGWVNPIAHDKAVPIPGDDTDILCKLAKENNVFISIGLAEKDGDNLFDSMVLIDNKGNIILKHRKINIVTELMDPPYTPGSSVNTVDTKFGKIGLLICADSFKEEVINDMKELKPDLMLIPYGWAAGIDAWPGHAKALERTVQNAAKTIGCPVIGTDLIGQISHGPWKGLVYGGASVVSDENGNILALGKDRDREVMIVTITY